MKGTRCSRRTMSMEVTLTRAGTAVKAVSALSVPSTAKLRQVLAAGNPIAAAKAWSMESSGQMPVPPPDDAVPPSGGHDYPLTFSVDYPDRDLDRLSTAFRIFTIIPIAILASALEGGSFGAQAGGEKRPVRWRRHRDPGHPRAADAAVSQEIP